jgi:hypothetical protein
MFLSLLLFIIFPAIAVISTTGLGSVMYEVFIRSELLNWAFRGESVDNIVLSTARGGMIILSLLFEFLYMTKTRLLLRIAVKSKRWMHLFLWVIADFVSTLVLFLF